MYRICAPTDGIGVLEPVVSVAREQGVLAGARDRSARGEPAEITLSVPLDREAIEAGFDLGPLVVWWPVEPATWALRDTYTGTTMTGPTMTGTATTSSPSTGFPPPAQTARPRVGYAADLFGWTSPPAEVELDRFAAEPSRSGWFRLVTCSSSAAEVLARVRDLLEIAFPGLAAGSADDVEPALPDWFRAACAPVRDDDAWARWFAERAAAPVADWRSLTWASRWTAHEWLRCVVRSERTWTWTGSREAEGGFELSLDLADGYAPLTSLKWLLHTAGATGCGPTAWHLAGRPSRVERP